MCVIYEHGHTSLVHGLGVFGTWGLYIHTLYTVINSNQAILLFVLPFWD